MHDIDRERPSPKVLDKLIAGCRDRRCKWSPYCSPRRTSDPRRCGGSPQIELGRLLLVYINWLTFGCYLTITLWGYISKAVPLSLRATLVEMVCTEHNTPHFRLAMWFDYLHQFKQVFYSSLITLLSDKLLLSSDQIQLASWANQLILNPL